MLYSFFICWLDNVSNLRTREKNQCANRQSPGNKNTKNIVCVDEQDEQILKSKDINNRWINAVRQRVFKTQFLSLELQVDSMDVGDEVYHISNVLVSRTTKFLCEQLYLKLSCGYLL